MAYYDWATIEMPLFLISPSESNFIVQGYLSLYINLLYGKQKSLTYYQSYPELSRSVCISNDIYCQSIFQELLCIGSLSFMILMIGSAIQAYDIYKMIQYFANGETNFDYQEEKQDNLRHITTIGLFFIGITLNLFGLYFMEIEITIGISFWVFISGIVLFIIIIIVEQVALDNLRKQKLILTILRDEKKASNNFNGTSIELSSESEAYI
jgi:hypothetical protein